MELIDFILHVDQHLLEFVRDYGTWIYAILFLIIFVETGLVVMPLLPGDSLLFAAGAIAATGAMDPVLLSILLFIAAVMGDSLNYQVGRYIGPRVFNMNLRFIKRDHLLKTQSFFEKHGGKTIIFARFLPIIRTFAPFIAGVSHMHYPRFLMFNVLGGAAWILSFIWLGFFFGNLPIIKDNFTYVIFAIIGISMLPAVLEMLRQYWPATKHKTKN
ncbi:cytochrome O ubiquinol oxidase [Alkanindiges hydrocarboniclasticus]|uniref:Cytochrome O ubiquinol oxidase n=1 Tax=Alkanindiges hydrocarboniclasticus TaxID=1907941 RepID=A0A1S8CVG3_9GAMM|nr:DedA family protein [Alkanindiges hydrocarboniclasticus]ONG41076.1 cytochrome O ubiquinol oxidase [Alkanindiges hydrocarboniclasticus]